MKTIYLLTSLLFITAFIGCADKKAAEEKARQDAEAKARAESARKEMETLPKVFRPRYDGKKLQPEPAKNDASTPTPEPTKK
jgi:hypothetical protein